MRSKLLAVLAVTTLLSFAGCKVQAQSSKTAIVDVFENGLWICKTPAIIVGLQEKFVTTSQNGVKLTPTVTDQLVRAQNGDCERLDADNIKPVASTGDFLLDASWSIIRVSDGKQEGWTGIDMYVAYMRHHVVRKPEAK